MARRNPAPVARLTFVRTLTLAAASSPGRRAHVAAASGVVSVGRFRYVIADDELHLGVFPRHGRGTGTLARVRRGRLPLQKKARKRRKPDFEALAVVPSFAGHPFGALLLLPSGSRPNRCAGALVPLRPDGGIAGAARKVDLSALYRAIGTAFPLNIEGAFVDGEHLALMQRANKGSGVNARIRVAMHPLLDALSRNRAPPRGAVFDMQTFDLGTIDGIPLGFTDAAALPLGGFAFTAVAEDTDDAYADGGCIGSAIGIVDDADRLVSLWRLVPALKVEGIEIGVVGRHVHIVVVTDADDASVAARLLRTRIAL